MTKARKPLKIADATALRKWMSDIEPETTRILRMEDTDSPRYKWAAEKRREALAKVWHNAESVTQWLKDENGKATAHTYTYALEIERLVEQAESKLDRDGVTVKNCAGTVVIAWSGVPTSKSYGRTSRGPVIATMVTLRRNGSAWYVDAVSRTDRWPGPGGGEKIIVSISKAARDDVVCKALAGYVVQSDKQESAAA